MTTQTASKSYDFAGITEISGLLWQRELSPVELVKSSLERISTLQARLNAFITVTTESALQAAQVAEKEIRQHKWRGPLQGVPIGIKDFYDIAGIKTTAAFEYFKDRVPNKDAACVDKLKQAGAIIIGKMNMDTLGMGTTGLESCFGPVKNPWNTEYIPGGSSSGSAAAVASGLCYATIDTDAIGSCRLPAACCGVVGFKGTYGLIDTTGILDGEKPPDEAIRWLSHAGITTRSVEDTAIVLDVLAERDGRSNGSFSSGLTQKRSLRIGVADNCKASNEILDAFENAVMAIQSLGYSTIRAAAPLADVSRGMALIEEDRKAIGHRSFKDVDVLLLPTTATATLMIKEAEKPLALSPENTMFANYYGLPAVSIPFGFDKHGLPVGLQIVAKPGDDVAVLRLAYQLQAASDYSKKHPST